MDQVTGQDDAQQPGFRYDTQNVDWKNFITEGCYYKILNVDVPNRTADMIVKFEPEARCIYHRHAATTITMVLEGALHVSEQTPNGEVVKIKEAGSFSAGAKGETHIEAGGPEGVVVYFSMRGDNDQIYDLLNPDFSLRKAITIQDFYQDWQHWNDGQAKPAAA